MNDKAVIDEVLDVLFGQFDSRALTKAAARRELQRYLTIAAPTPAVALDKLDSVGDRNVESVISKHRLRAEAGLKKYGVTTERGDLTDAQWLQHLQDELLDAAVYVEALLSQAAAGMGEEGEAKHAN